MDTEQRKRRQLLSYVVVILFVLSNLVIGLVGGVAGFVMLANSKSPAIVKLRARLGVDDTAKLSIPVRQTVRLEESSAVIDVAKKVTPAVVSISASQTVSDFFGRTSNQEVGGGTGFILTSDGLIVTNRHVVEANAQYKVILNDGRILDAKIQAIDTLNDFAVVKVDAKDLPTVEIGSSDDLQVGQTVIAIGNALGEFKNSVTVGVVSAKQRSLEAGGGVSGSEKLSGLIQTDAAINPGNSGGPLVNLKGQVVGINTAIATNGSSGSIGVGFSIAMDTLKPVIDSVRKNGEIIRPYLGVRYVPINATIQKLNNLSTDYGALVARGQTQGEVAVQPGSPADKAGIVENDIILEINGERIDEENPLVRRLQRYQVGDEVTLKIQRKGDTLQIKVKLERSSN